ADVLAIDVVARVHVRQLFGETDGVERVAGRAEHRAKLPRPLLEALEVILTVIEKDTPGRSRDDDRERPQRSRSSTVCGAVAALPPRFSCHRPIRAGHRLNRPGGCWGGRPARPSPAPATRRHA